MNQVDYKQKSIALTQVEQGNKLGMFHLGNRANQLVLKQDIESEALAKYDFDYTGKPECRILRNPSSPILYMVQTYEPRDVSQNLPQTRVYEFTMQNQVLHITQESVFATSKEFPDELKLLGRRVYSLPQGRGQVLLNGQTLQSSAEMDLRYSEVTNVARKAVVSQIEFIQQIRGLLDVGLTCPSHRGR